MFIIAKFKNFSAKIPKRIPPAFIPQTPFCGRAKTKSVEAKRKNSFPQKNRFSFCRVRIEAPPPPRFTRQPQKEKKFLASLIFRGVDFF